MNNALQIIVEATKDTIIAIPFLIIAFFLIDVIQHRFGKKAKAKLYNLGKLGPLYGALLGSLPQCGFSVIASTLFIEKIISPGTLIAVYIATSDEAIPVLLANPQAMSKVFPLIAVKIIIGILAGTITDAIWHRYRVINTRFVIKEEEHCSHDCIGDERKSYREILGHAFTHTFQVAIYIFAATVLLNIVFKVNESQITKIFESNVIYQPFMTAIFGLIPNCAASVIITQAYILRIITFGALIAGLSTNAGLGLLVLFKETKTKKDALKIVFLLLLFGIGFGVLIDLLYPLTTTLTKLL